MSACPVLKTERLVLRPHRAEDFPAACGFWADIAATSRLAIPAAPGDVWARMTRYAGMWALLGYGYWLIETREGTMVGEAGLGDFRRDMTPAAPDRPEAGWSIASDARGRGYAGEAAAAFLRWADGALADPATWCFIDPDNTPSLRLAARLGYRETGRARFRDADVACFARPRGG